MVTDAQGVIRHADLIPPPTGPLERGHDDLAVDHFAVRNVAKWSSPALERIRSQEHGMDLGPLEPMLPGHLASESGKIELAPERLLADLDRLESWLAEEPATGLRLISRRDIRSMNSWLHNLPALAKGRDRCTLQIHPDDAAERGLETGAVALLRTRVGEIRAPVEVTTDVMKGVVSLPHGFGHTGDGIALSVAKRKPGADVNAVTDDAEGDVPSGTSVLFGVAVEVLAAPAA